jgi:Cdc6-like AAA superfamily ATPase
MRSIDQKTLEILAWLSPLEFPLIQNDLISRRQEGTGLWLLRSDEFQNWLNGDQGTLFCPGIPGAGKTMLASIAIDHLSRKFQNESVGIAFAFCSYQNRKEQTPVNLFSSLLEQLIQRRSSIPEDIIQLYDYHVTRRTRPVLDEVFKPLLSEINRHTQTFIVVDALDECDEGSRSLFISKLRTLTTSNTVNLLVTSRPNSVIMHEFQQGIQLEIRASVEDVQRYLEGQMHRLPRCILKDKHLQEEIINGINEVVDGM